MNSFLVGFILGIATGFLATVLFAKALYERDNE